jgi:hypothetical protein
MEALEFSGIVFGVSAARLAMPVLAGSLAGARHLIAAASGLCG